MNNKPINKTRIIITTIAYLLLFFFITGLFFTDKNGKTFEFFSKSATWIVIGLVLDWMKRKYGFNIFSSKE